MSDNRLRKLKTIDILLLQALGLFCFKVFSFLQNTSLFLFKKSKNKKDNKSQFTQVLSSDPSLFFLLFFQVYFFYFTELYCPRQRCSNILLVSRFLGTGCTGPTGTETQFSKRINSMASTPRSLPTLLWYVLGLVLLG